MSEPGLSQMLATAAALLLRAPDARVLAALTETDGVAVDLDTARQDFYDVLCVPHSGRYIPPYAHVLVKGRLEEKDLWHFSAPRFDGGDVLAPWYDAVGFAPREHDIDPMLRGPHRPLDNVGLIIAYLAGLVASRDADDAGTSANDALIVRFMTEHVDPWVERFCHLLGGSASPYLSAVAEALREAVQATRDDCSAAIGRPVADSPSETMPMGTSA
jgi:hypothetical protein